MKVFIVMSSLPYVQMFEDKGWAVVDSILDADLVQFTGGSDVSPQLYGEKQHTQTYSNRVRDREEEEIFKACVALDKPMAGICRGGQFLNVMSGGKMWQDVDRHALSGTHNIKDKFTGDNYQATSTHHQMMRPSDDGLIIGIGCDSLNGKRLSTFKEHVAGGKIARDYDNSEDVEVVYYPRTNSLCFQPHPEFNNGLECRKHYFRYIEDYCFANKVGG